MPSGEPIVSVKELCAGWGRNAPEVLRGASLRIFPGEIYAVIGGNGSGKSTLLKVICGMLRQTSGRVKLRRGLVPAYLPQNPCMLFTQDTAGQEAPAEYLERFGLAELSGRDPLDLSGGERQRISIARAFLKDAPIILLDEATASLDVENETAIQEALSRLIKNKTVLIIAHRMRTVAGADQVVVLSGGIVAEQGSPAELYARKGLYTHMVDLQSASQNWTI